MLIPRTSLAELHNIQAETQRQERVTFASSARLQDIGWRIVSNTATAVVLIPMVTGEKMMPANQFVSSAMALEKLIALA